MTTSYSNLPAVNPVADVSEIPVAVRGKDIDPLLFDLLRTVSPHGKESKINELLLAFISKVQPDITPHVDVKGNLIMQIGKHPKTMFSCHTDTVQGGIDQEFTTLHISPEMYVHASIPSDVTWYENSAGDTVTDLNMKQEARSDGKAFPFYTLLDGRLYGSKNQFDGWVDTQKRYATRTAVKPKACVLGADDKLGCYILCRLIEAGVDGLYVFHIVFDYRHIPHPPILLCPAHSAHSTSGPRYLCISANRCGIPWNKHTDMVFDIPLNRSRPYSDIQRTEVWELRTIRVLHDRNVRRRSPDVDKLVLPAE